MAESGASGSTKRLLELSAGYFVSYMATGILVKYFTKIRRPPMTELAYLVQNTAASSFLALVVVLLLGWYRLQSNGSMRVGPLRVPMEYAYLIPSGICTAIVIPTTTLMYLLPISVMVAMTIMRGSVIVISRLVDAIQIRQGIVKRTVHADENRAVFFALLAVATNVLFVPLTGGGNGSFDFLKNRAALLIMGSYISAYAVRIYIMNYWKNTRPAGVRQDNRGFFAIEQIAASATLFLVGLLIFHAPALFGRSGHVVTTVRESILHPDPAALVSGIPWGIVAFFSVFLFLFEGRTATFAGLVNRLVSLLAGTASTLVLAAAFGQPPPQIQDWVAFGFILVAVAFLARAEQRRGAAKEPATELRK